MALAAISLIRYTPYACANATETPHPIEAVRALGRATRHQPGGEISQVELAGRRLV